jgi:hypothetical protein
MLACVTYRSLRHIVCENWCMEWLQGWTPDAVALVERSIAGHGGQERWQSAKSIRLPFRSGSGALLAVKGFSRTFPPPREIEIFPHDCITVFHGYPEAGRRGRFFDGSVRIESSDGREVFAESLDHRGTFRGLSKFRRWSPLDAAYFFGYALWHYHVVPFTLGMARLHGILRRRGVPQGVDVSFPEGIHTHCRRQQFYFGAEGRIVRHDYVAEVIGPMARGAHLWEDYEQRDGLSVARRRRVMVRLGSYATPLEVMCIQLGDPIVIN